MGTLRYFSFHGTKISGKPISRGGYLSFLPDTYGHRLSNGMQYRYYELEFMVLLEVWGAIPDEGVRMDLLSDHIGFWQIYQLMGASLLYLPHNLELGENRCLPLATKRNKVTVQWQSSEIRLLTIGYKQAGVPALVEEYPSLNRLVEFGKDTDTLDLLFPDISINYRFRDILGHISELKYRSFHTRAELGVQLGMLFDELESAMLRSTEGGGRSQLRIYHQALTYIAEHFMENITKESIAESLHISPRTLNRAFEGRPIKIADYIQRLRFNKARDMLDEGKMSVEEVANELNFPNRKYFSREFKKYFFDSPSNVKGK